MFSFFRRPDAHAVTPELTQALISSGLPSGTDSGSLRIVQKRGAYSGRPVRYFRVFDAARASERAIEPHTFADLDLHPDLVLGSGHLERDGKVVLNHRS